MRKEIIESITDQIIEESKGEVHPDEVARIYSVFMAVGHELMERFVLINESKNKS